MVDKGVSQRAECVGCARPYCSKQYTTGCGKASYLPVDKALSEEEQAKQLKRYIVSTAPVGKKEENGENDGS